MDVRSGEVLLTAGVPDYDPNAPGLDPSEPVGFSLPVHWPLEPGSTVKPFVVARALAEGAISRGERFDNHGGAWRLPGRTIRNVAEIPTTPMTAREVLRHSSNIGAAQIGMRLGAERMRALWLDLGLHQSGGVPALEGHPGHFPSDADWGKPNAAHWSVASTAYGHEISFTPLRLACAWSALLNGGVLMRPQWFLGQPPQPERRVFPEAVAREVSGWLEEVVSGRADNVLPAWPDLRWGGKSGTAKKTHEDGYDLLFVAFGPTEDPRVVVVVVVDDPKQGKPRGSLMAGPAAGRILRGALEQLGVVGPASRLDSRVPPDTVHGR
jgi:cell division protein FtsI (penicillin-binding protein 3)